MLKQTTVFLAVLEAIGREWEDNYTPEAVRLDQTKVGVLVQVEDLLWGSGACLGADAIREHAPTFFDQFWHTTFRELGAPFGHPREVAASATNG